VLAGIKKADLFVKIVKNPRSVIQMEEEQKYDNEWDDWT